MASDIGVQLVVLLGLLCWCWADHHERCEEGWTGPECEVALCPAGCHPIHGNCTRPGQCVCVPGWRGRQCRECVPRAGCQHGSCTDTNDCLCHPGWSGPLCARPVCEEGCHSVHGYCHVPGECKCRVGYSGPTCHECQAPTGCLNGFCTKPLECKCNPGWSGPLCDTPVCAEGCSEKQGYCTKPGECRCEVGWWGERCNLCFPYPGCEHGTCEKPWECVCEAGWSGMLCDTPASGGAFCGTHRGWCLNGGTCIDVPGGRNFTCSCPSLFTGQRCDYLADLTSDAPAADPGGILSTGTRHNVRVISPDNSSPSGTYSLTQPTTSNISKDTDEVTDATEEVKVEEDPKDVRRRFLQKHARISFRQPKLASSEEQSSKLPYMVVERKLLPLPVVLPRVSDIIPRDQMLAHKLNKQPTPILILGDSDNTQDNSKTMRYSLQQQTETSGRNQISENRRFLRHQQGSPGFISSVGENRNGPAPPHGGPVLVKVLNSQRRPILVSAQARALPRRNPMTPATLRTHKRPRQQSQAHMKPPTTTTTTPSTTKTTTTTTTEPPTRPTTKPSTWPPTRPSIWPTTWPSSHATTPIFQEPFTFTARTSPPSSRLPSPSPGTPVALPFTSADLGPPEDFVALEGRESIIRTYYDENANGRVHIGDISRVDDAAPHDEIFDAFIELKKV
ncbi:uncharacterized protein LOC121872369 [Homarus americanus]|uniref:uncharacterized protein LOC121872369 n=1 Tax=Homarus americanus TaxID=6706 RepID=UPI001C47D9B7|nr:uncharacterized protein LOC121872369 [Homarus americanus]XP_042231042.1 uncharacterized protein LOC121872369 [Homarus americanus]